MIVTTDIVAAVHPGRETARQKAEPNFGHPHAQHTFSNDGEVTVRMVGTFSPARFENYFEDLAQEIEKHEGQRPDPAVIARLYAKYDSELVTLTRRAAILPTHENEGRRSAEIGCERRCARVDPGSADLFGRGEPRTVGRRRTTRVGNSDRTLRI
jgi:hypothetical protein